MPFCCRGVMPNEPVEPAGKSARDTAPPVYATQLSASARSRPATFTTPGTAFGSLRLSAWMGPGLITSSWHADRTAASARDVRHGTPRRIVPEVVEVMDGFL